MSRNSNKGFSRDFGAKVEEALMSWWQRHGRTLPWRKKKATTYEIWVSEVMLQQTQAARAAEYFLRFRKRFPTLKSLADAEWEDVLPYWRGLGYYRRGQNLLRTAKILRDDWGGRFPRDFDALQKLPGIGRYTAAAICSFSFLECRPALDTNLRRVLLRVFGEKNVEATADEFFRNAQAPSASLNHALMDIGALFCHAKRVDCEVCPLKSCCNFELPKAPPRPLKVKKNPPLYVACLHHEGKYFLLRQGSELSFPELLASKHSTYRSELKEFFEQQFGVEIAVRPPFLENEGRRFCRCQVLQAKKIPRKSAWKQLEDPECFPEEQRAAVRRLLP